MALEKTDKIWMDGEFVDWDDANVHVLTHALHYGSGVFEGIRCYDTPKGSAVFRLTDHIQRLRRSAKMLFMDLPCSVDEFVEATKETVRVNSVKECYIRPLVFRGYGVMGLDSLPAPVNCSIAVWPWGSYLGEESLKHGVTAGISSWRQRGNNATPPQVKATGNYINSSFARVEANAHGYDEAILLSETGNVCEGTGENIFVIRDGVVTTPPVSDGLLPGITRDSVMTLARDKGYDVREASLVRTDLYAADEVFMCGTAAELVPVRSVDQITIGEPGPITKDLQETYLGVVHGEYEEYSAWLELV